MALSRLGFYNFQLKTKFLHQLINFEDHSMNMEYWANLDFESVKCLSMIAKWTDPNEVKLS